MCTGKGNASISARDIDSSKLLLKCEEVAREVGVAGERRWRKVSSESVGNAPHLSCPRVRVTLLLWCWSAKGEGGVMKGFGCRWREERRRSCISAGK